MLVAKRFPMVVETKQETEKINKGEGRVGVIRELVEQKRLNNAAVTLFKGFANFINTVKYGKNLPKGTHFNKTAYHVEMDRAQAARAYKRVKQLHRIEGAEVASEPAFGIEQVRIRQDGIELLVTFQKTEENRYMLSVEIH